MRPMMVPCPTSAGSAREPRRCRAWQQYAVGVATGRRDAVAGIAVAAYLVPQCLAYARLAGLNPVAGLWAALPALVVYAFLGSSRVLSVGPESASALLVGSAVATLTRRARPVTRGGRLGVGVGGGGPRAGWGGSRAWGSSPTSSPSPC